MSSIFRGCEVANRVLPMFFTFFGNNFPRSKCETAETETPLWRPQEQFYSTKKKMHPPNPNPTAHGPKHAVLNTTEAHQLRWRQANFFFFPIQKKCHTPPLPPCFIGQCLWEGHLCLSHPFRPLLDQCLNHASIISWHIVLGKRRGK